MNCPTCGGPIEVRPNSTYRYAESGLDDIDLMGVEVRHCSKCGDSVVIPDMPGLHRVIARDLAMVRHALRSQEIDFLAKYVSYSEHPKMSKVGLEVQEMQAEGSIQPIRAVAEMALRVATLMVVDGDPKQIDKFMQQFRREASVAKARLAKRSRQITKVRRSKFKKEWRIEQQAA